MQNDSSAKLKCVMYRKKLVDSQSTRVMLYNIFETTYSHSATQVCQN